MNKAFERFSRSIALVLLVTVSFISCPVSPGGPPPEDPPKLTPGVGTPRSFYLDSQGNYIETEADGPGRTGLIVENNKLAEGVLIYSDDTDYDDRVAFVYQDSIVSMFFKKNRNFPYRMAITDGSDAYYAYLSSYNVVSHTYRVTFMHNGVYDMIGNVVLNDNIFYSYRDDPELSDSQNRRMANMIVAMGVWGSLYATFEQQDSAPGGVIIYRGILSSAFKKVAKVFSYVAVAAAVVATIVAPIVTFINPVVGLALEVVAVAVGKISIGIAAAAIGLAVLFDALEDKDGPQRLPPPISTGGLPVVYVMLYYENDRLIKYNENGIHEELSLLPGKELAVKFNVPQGKFSGMTTDKLYTFMCIDEPSEDKGTLINALLFEPVDVASISDEEFVVRIKRLPKAGHYGDGIINFGFIFVFKDKDEKTLDFQVNGYEGGFYFRLPTDEGDEPVLHKNMVVIYIRMVG